MMNILAHLVRTRAVDFYAVNGDRLTSDRLTEAARDLYYIAIRHNLNKAEAETLNAYLIDKCADARPDYSLQRGWRGLYTFDDRQPNGHQFRKIEDDYIIVQIYNDMWGLA